MQWLAVIKSLGGYALTLAILAAGVLLGLLVVFLLRRIAGRLGRGEGRVVLRSLQRHLRGPLRLVAPLVFVAVLMPFVPLPDPARLVLARLADVLITVAIGWAIAKAGYVLEDILLGRYHVDQSDNLRARKLYTQLQYLKRVFAVVVVVITAAIVLTGFRQLQQLGTTILASAGIAGIVLGFAAQRSLGVFFAGIQIALTQPIRIDDVVIVEGEYGNVEEIALTFVVVRIWDLRRLVIPINYFTEKPFQNWTRTSAALLGTVMLYCDYSVPVEALRAELQRILRGSPLWDGEVAGLQVTDASERTVQLRALMSARDAPGLWDLRCSVREQLIEFIRREYPQGLPRLRVETEPARAVAAPAP